MATDEDMAFADRRTANILLTILLFAVVVSVLYTARRILLIFVFAIQFLNSAADSPQESIAGRMGHFSIPPAVASWLGSCKPRSLRHSRGRGELSSTSIGGVWNCSGAHSMTRHPLPAISTGTRS
jgi:hypothetical protein